MTANLLPELPDDIIFAFASQLKSNGSYTDLCSFTLTCKRWRDIGCPVLFSHIGLDFRTLARFNSSFPIESHARHVKSLTLDIDRPLEEHPDGFHFGEFGTLPPERKHEILSAERALPGSLKSFAEKIQNFARLSSLSFQIAHYGTREVSRSTIVELVQNLPESLVHLELDTSATDSREYDEDVHVCDAVRQILPRLHTLRLCLASMCPAIFTEIEPDQCSSKDTSQEKVVDSMCLSNMKSMLLVCGKTALSAAYDCKDKVPIRGGRSVHFPDDNIAYKAISRELLRFTDHHKNSLRKASIYTIIEAGPGGIDDLACRSKLRVDFLKHETWASPIVHIDQDMDKKTGHHFLMRTPADEVITASDQTLDDFAEGHLWRNVHGGIRLPAHVLLDERRGLPSIAAGLSEKVAPRLRLQAC